MSLAKKKKKNNQPAKQTNYFKAIRKLSKDVTE